MSIKASFSGGKDFKVTPAGNHVARVYSIVHLGVVPGEYMGDYKETDTVRIGFELPNELDTFGDSQEQRPYTIHQEYTLSMGEKANLRKLVEGILGQGLLDQDAESFEVTDLMGRTCMINVVHRVSKAGRTYAQITSAAPLPKGLEAPEAVNQQFLLDFEENWSTEKFESLPDFVKDKITSTRNYRIKMGITDDTKDIAYPPDEINPEDIPF